MYKKMISEFIMILLFFSLAVSSELSVLVQAKTITPNCRVIAETEKKENNISYGSSSASKITLKARKAYKKYMKNSMCKGFRVLDLGGEVPVLLVNEKVNEPAHTDGLGAIDKIVVYDAGEINVSSGVLLDCGSMPYCIRYSNHKLYYAFHHYVGKVSLKGTKLKDYQIADAYVIIDQDNELEYPNYGMFLNKKFKRMSTEKEFNDWFEEYENAEILKLYKNTSKNRSKYII